MNSRRKTAKCKFIKVDGLDAILSMVLVEYGPQRGFYCIAYCLFIIIIEARKKVYNVVKKKNVTLGLPMKKM